MNGHTIGFHPQTQKLELHIIHKLYYVQVLPKRFHLNGHTIGFRPQTQKLELHTKQIVACESTGKEVLFEWSHHMISSTDSKVMHLSMLSPRVGGGGGGGGGEGQTQGNLTF